MAITPVDDWDGKTCITLLGVGLDGKDIEAALKKLLGFIATSQADPRDGIWLDTVTADGQPKLSRKASACNAR